MTIQISAGPNLSAIVLMGPAKRRDAVPPSKAPMVDAMMHMPSARDASPFLIRGYPSNAVTAPPAVPGMFSMTEGNEFPISAPA